MLSSDDMALLMASAAPTRFSSIAAICGKACATAADCSGVCFADTRTCSPVTPLFGCFDYLDEAGKTVGICID